MKTNYKVAIALVAGAAIGGAAIQGLHAQAAFVIAEVDVSNQDGFAKEYVPVAVKALTESGSKPVARGGKTASIEGAPPKRIVINSFDTLDQAVAAYNSRLQRSEEDWQQIRNVPHLCRRRIVAITHTSLRQDRGPPQLAALSFQTKRAMSALGT
jgi:uncharacterized protein (DUF1330 family)